MHQKNTNFEEQGNPFALSIGDLMAALLLIFILLLSATLLRLKDEQDDFKSKTQVAEKYLEIKKQIFEALNTEFKNDLKKWNAEIVEDELLIRFNSSSKGGFDGPRFYWSRPGDYELNEDHIQILNDFFPRYIKVIHSKKFRKNIQEIRIEGHTDKSWGVDGDPGYIKNMELSQDRTRSVLEYSLNTVKDNDKLKWCKKSITANGLSYSKLLTEEDPTNEINRRVEFRIVTNAEQELKKLLKIGEQESDFYIIPYMTVESEKKAKEIKRFLTNKNLNVEYLRDSDYLSLSYNKKFVIYVCGRFKTKKECQAKLTELKTKKNPSFKGASVRLASKNNLAKKNDIK